MIKRAEFLPYALPYHNSDEIEAITETIANNWWSRGPKTAQFEKDFAAYIGVNHALALNSCTAALHLALVVKGVTDGDEVITTPMTFAASANIIAHVGATPVFCDIDPTTGLIDPSKIEEKITPKTKAILPVHYAGQSCDMDKINAIAKKYNLFVLEDAAHAVHTTYKGKMVGNNQNITAYSFYATKNLATGEGGMLTCNDDEFMEQAGIYSLHGMSRNAWNRYAKGGSMEYDILHPGYKYNMTDIAASLGICQLKKINEMQKRREHIAEIYNKRFALINGIQPLSLVNYGRHAWHLYIIKIGDELSISRDEFASIIKEEYNIGVSLHFKPVHLHSYYQNTHGTKLGDYPCVEAFYKQILSIPLYPSMSEEDVNYVTEAVRDIAERFSN